MASLSPDQLFVELEKLAAAPSADLLSNTELCAKLSGAARRASLALEQPTEVITRLLLSYPVESTLVTIALDLELFSKLVHPDPSPKSFTSLVDTTGADRVLLSTLQMF